VSEPILALSEVRKDIRGKTVLQPFTYTLQPGRVLALCGGNGAGKSTLLRMIAGITIPSSGSVRVDGVEWRKDRKAYAERIGYMPDDFRFGEALTALETLRFYAALKRVSEERVRECLGIVGLEDTGKKPASAFSKGMKQRLMFAQAILAQPKLLLLDEPTNGMDPYWTGMFSELLRQLKEAGQTVVFSTHHLHVAESVADEAVFLSEGKVTSSGTIESYRERFGESGLNGAFAEAGAPADSRTVSGQAAAARKG
jgi:ABC-type multidrug transport system ATPase subunit